MLFKHVLETMAEINGIFFLNCVVVVIKHPEFAYVEIFIHRHTIFFFILCLKRASITKYKIKFKSMWKEV
jgi:hypothetical protein